MHHPADDKALLDLDALTQWHRLAEAQAAAWLRLSRGDSPVSADMTDRQAALWAAQRDRAAARLTVRDILAAPHVWDGVTCCAPIEPTYRDHAQTGKINTGSGRVVSSWAHGIQRIYALGTDEEAAEIKRARWAEFSRLWMDLVGAVEQTLREDPKAALSDETMEQMAVLADNKASAQRPARQRDVQQGAAALGVEDEIPETRTMQSPQVAHHVHRSHLLVCAHQQPGCLGLYRPFGVPNRGGRSAARPTSKRTTTPADRRPNQLDTAANREPLTVSNHIT